MRLTHVRIRELRKKKGYTQKQLAEKVNVSPQVVSNWERRYSSIDDENIKKLAEVLDTTTDYLLGNDKKIEFIPQNNDYIIKEIVEKYKLDLTQPGVKEKLEKIIELVVDDMKK